MDCKHEFGLYKPKFSDDIGHRVELCMKCLVRKGSVKEISERYPNIKKFWLAAFEDATGKWMYQVMSSISDVETNECDLPVVPLEDYSELFDSYMETLHSIFMAGTKPYAEGAMLAIATDAYEKLKLTSGDAKE